jgi:anti-anti-sigma factor
MSEVHAGAIVTVAIEPENGSEAAELVRGQEKALLERVAPLLRDHSVTLDMARVERIDAAGIAALITLYCAARQANHAFTVSHATPRVEEILQLVGVRRLFASHEMEDASDYSLSLELAEA